MGRRSGGRGPVAPATTGGAAAVSYRERTELHLALIGLAKIVAYGIAGGIITLCATPLITAFAGRNTGISVQAAFSFTATVSLALAGVAVDDWRRWREVQRLERRNIRLEGNVRVLKERLRAKGGDLSGLDE